MMLRSGFCNNDKWRISQRTAIPFFVFPSQAHHASCGTLTEFSCVLNAVSFSLSRLHESERFLRVLDAVNCCNNLLSIGKSIKNGPFSSAIVSFFSSQIVGLWNDVCFSLVDAIFLSRMVISESILLTHTLLFLLKYFNVTRRASTRPWEARTYF